MASGSFEHESFESFEFLSPWVASSFGLMEHEFLELSEFLFPWVAALRTEFFESSVAFCKRREAYWMKLAAVSVVLLLSLSMPRAGMASLASGRCSLFLM